MRIVIAVILIFALTAIGQVVTQPSGGAPGFIFDGTGGMTSIAYTAHYLGIVPGAESSAAQTVKDSGGSNVFAPVTWYSDTARGDAICALVWTDASTKAGPPQCGMALNATRPTCSATFRGQVWTVPGAGGVADTVAVCAKSSADTYAWRSIY